MSLGHSLSDSISPLPFSLVSLFHTHALSHSEKASLRRGDLHNSESGQRWKTPWVVKCIESLCIPFKMKWLDICIQRDICEEFLLMWEIKSSLRISPAGQFLKPSVDISGIWCLKLHIHLRLQRKEWDCAHICVKYPLKNHGVKSEHTLLTSRKICGPQGNILETQGMWLTYDQEENVCGESWVRTRTRQTPSHQSLITCL